MKKTPYFLTEEGLNLIIDTANNICEAKGWANKVSKNDAIPIISALYILQKSMKKGAVQCQLGEIQ